MRPPGQDLVAGDLAGDVTGAGNAGISAEVSSGPRGLPAAMLAADLRGTLREASRGFSSRPDLDVLLVAPHGIAVRRVSASTLALTRMHRQRLRNVCAPLGAVCACGLRSPPSTAGMPRDAISGPNEAAGVERGLALQSQAIPDLLGGL